MVENMWVKYTYCKDCKTYAINLSSLNHIPLSETILNQMESMLSPEEYGAMMIAIRKYIWENEEPNFTAKYLKGMFDAAIKNITEKSFLYFYRNRGLKNQKIIKEVSPNETVTPVKEVDTDPVRPEIKAVEPDEGQQWDSAPTPEQKPIESLEIGDYDSEPTGGDDDFKDFYEMLDSHPEWRNRSFEVVWNTNAGRISSLIKSTGTTYQQLEQKYNSYWR